MSTGPTIIGRTGCRFCGFEHAHVKRGDGKRAYVHCPECGLLTQARSGHQEQLLMKDMRAPDALAAPKPVATAPEPLANAPMPLPPTRPRGLWDSLMGGAAA